MARHGKTCQVGAVVVVVVVAFFCVCFWSCFLPPTESELAVESLNFCIQKSYPSEAQV